MADFLAKATDRIANRIVRHFPRRRIDCRVATPIVSFTFDDAPDTAWTNGSRILDEHGVRGTFYISGGLVGAVEDDRRLISAEGCRALAASGHELGCHTYSHVKLRTLSRSELRADLDRNRAFLTAIDGRTTRRNFAFPYIMGWPPAQSLLASRFATARGGLQGVNRSGTDPHFLRGAEIRSSDDLEEPLLGWIKDVVADPGWLIFFTHDISETPTSYGCTPVTLARLVAEALERGCRVMPVDAAAAALGIAEAEAF